MVELNLERKKKSREDWRTANKALHDILISYRNDKNRFVRARKLSRRRLSFDCWDTQNTTEMFWFGRLKLLRFFPVYTGFNFWCVQWLVCGGVRTCRDAVFALLIMLRDILLRLWASYCECMQDFAEFHYRKFSQTIIKTPSQDFTWNRWQIFSLISPWDLIVAKRAIKGLNPPHLAECESDSSNCQFTW